MKNIVRILPLAGALALLSCSTVQNGTVVGKRHRQPEPGFTTLGDVYVLEVEQPGPNGRHQLKNVLVSEQEWSHYKIGDRYSKVLLAPPTKAATPKPTPAVKLAVKKTLPQKPAAKPTATPKKAASPKPEKRIKPSPAKTPAAHPRPAKPKPTPSATPQPTFIKPLATPKAPSPSVATPSPKPTPAISKSAPTATPKPMPVISPSPKPRLTISTTDRVLLSETKTQAMEDPQVRALKDKIHVARTDEEQRQAAADYDRALYLRMRQISPQLAPKIEQEESDALKNP